jgi:hypothetical protein
MLGQALQIPNDNVTGPGLFGSSWDPANFPVVSSMTVYPGPTFSSGACLVSNGQSGSPIYLYSWGLFFWITTESALQTYQQADHTAHRMAHQHVVPQVERDADFKDVGGVSVEPQ